MPNWCHCELTITGQTEELIRFRDGIKRRADASYLEILASYHPIPRAFDGISTGRNRLTDGRTVDIWREVHNANENALPIYAEVSAEEQEALIHSHGATNSYDWCSTFWGSKWGDCHTELCEDLVHRGHEDCLVYIFDTAWCCPCPGFREVSRNFPFLTFAIDYREEMMSFYGYYVCRNGEALEDCVADTYADAEED